jgi:phytoene/squalene synthetase
MKHTIPSTLAPSITKAASKQTYYTIRFLTDRDRVADAYRAYAYFRWVDDRLDSDSAPSRTSRTAFLNRQKSLLERCYCGESPEDKTPEEQMLVELTRRDHESNRGLQSYLYNMMQLMEFDTERRGRLISQAELTEYTRWLATAVTEALHYFIGHKSDSPHNETRYLAVAGAHITHMLRDTYDDLQAGYYNIPREVLESNHMQPRDIQSRAYRTWVQSRVQLARKCFQSGKEYFAQVGEPRCRLAGYAYTARFAWLLDTIEQENYSLRPEYTERKSLGTGLRMGISILSALVNVKEREMLHQPVVSQPLRKL